MLTLLCVTCKKNDNEVDVNNAGYKPAIRQAGEKIGDAEKHTFGASATSISSQNGEIRIDIPAQTIDGTGVLTIQKIKNTSPGGLDEAYRISFDKLINKPVTVKFSYEGKMDSLSANPECSSGVSIQDSVSGIWALQTKVVFNSIEKHVAFDTEAKKFDIAFVRPLTLTPTSSTVRPLAEVSLRVTSNIPPIGEDLCSLYGSDEAPIPLCDDFLVESAVIKKWELLSSGKGAGTLEPKGSKAIYKTSAYELPDINPATILVFFNHSIKPLSAKVFVKPEVTGLKFWIGDQPYAFTDSVIDAGISNGIFGMSWDHVNHSGSLNCLGGSPGTYNWSQTTQFLFEPGDITPPQAFQHYYNDGLTVSAGDIKITQRGTVGQRIVGSFEITNAGSTNTETSAYLGARKIVGVFNVMRDY